MGVGYHGLSGGLVLRSTILEELLIFVLFVRNLYFSILTFLHRVRFLEDYWNRLSSGTISFILLGVWCDCGSRNYYLEHSSSSMYEEFRPKFLESKTSTNATPR